MNPSALHSVFSILRRRCFRFVIVVFVASIGLTLFVAEADAQNASPTINTLAGTGTSGFVGDGGQATQAELSYPSANFWSRSSTEGASMASSGCSTAP